jgi:hypothetical protein
MLPADARSKWSPDLLTDSRVSHRWDEGKVVGPWFAPRTSGIKPLLAPGSAWGNGDILWDAYLGSEFVWASQIGQVRRRQNGRRDRPLPERTCGEG